MTQPDRSRWCDLQHQSLKNIIPGLIDLQSQIDDVATASTDADIDLDKAQQIADTMDKLSAELADIKGSVTRLLGKKQKVAD